MTWQLLYWPLACLLTAAAQGLLLPAIKRTPPGAEARRQSVALHGLLTAVYFLPLVLAPSLLGMGLGAGCRLLLFDPTLNLASGAPAFAVGNTAITDKTLRWLAVRVDWPVERVRGVVWLASIMAVLTFARWMAHLSVHFWAY